MELFVGTSGYAYKEWRGDLYPDGLSTDAMLRCYAATFRTVEVNNTFYRMPALNVVERWRDEVPPGFRFTLKASRRITHLKRLNDIAEPLRYVHETAAVLGDKLGPFLYQLPPNFKINADRLQAFLDQLPPQHQAVFEFRHESWEDESIVELLRAHGAALCAADTDDHPAAPIPTAPFGYLRLRAETYSEEELRAWADRIRRLPWREVFVYFKHEHNAPRLARTFAALWTGTPG